VLYSPFLAILSIKIRNDADTNLQLSLSINYLNGTEYKLPYTIVGPNSPMVWMLEGVYQIIKEAVISSDDCPEFSWILSRNDIIFSELS
jgi:hypothetical protein